MSMESGKRLGPYEIVSPIGAGGMGEVYKALDTRLDRTVAIKVLPAEFAQNAQLKLRFEREAKVISQLTHPNICTLHDVGNENGIEYLVMELIEGESLADRLARGPLPIDQALRHGIEIADALDQAHRAGVVHRDLKPGNIMLTKSGAKLLDFGLAKASAAPLAGGSMAGRDATMARPLTQEGTVIGTFQYMAPEQLAGEEADSRTDIFALGAVLYEMATGKRAFEGKTRTSLVAAIAGGEPRPIKELQPLTPPAFEHVVAKCLAKEPERRWQSAGDIADELRWVSQSGSEAGVAAPLSVRRKKREFLAWSLHALTALIAIGATWAWLHSRQKPKQVIESSLLPPANYRVDINQGGMVISPDATMVVFVVVDSKATRVLAVRPMSADGFRFLAGTDEAMYPFWSPDSREIAFFAQGKLKAVDAAGGAVRNIADAPLGRGGAWGPDGTILFCPEPRKPLMRVSANGAGAVEATKLGGPNEGHRWPAFLADGKHFTYSVLSPNKAPSIAVGSLDTVAPNRVLIESSSFALPTRVGWVLFQRENSLVGWRFDGEKLSGDAVVVVNTVSGSGPGALAASVADDGTIVYARGLPYVSSELVWVDRNGRELEKVASNGVFFCPAISHDGRRVAADVSNQESGAGDIWIYDVARKRQSRLTYDPGNESSPLWSPDDKRIYHISEAAGPDDLWVIPAGGTGAPEKVFANDRAKRTTDISRDGKWIIFNSSSGRPSAAMDIWTYSTTEKVAKAWLETPFGEGNATLSPDGKWIAYQSNESGRNEIYVRAFPESDEKWMVSSTGGTTPTWRGDGREIFYISLDQKMMAVPVKPGNPFDAGTPAVLFDVSLRAHIARQYDVSPEGTKFLINRQVESDVGVPATVLQNWVTRHR